MIPSFTVVIPTFNGKDKIDIVLSSLRSQSNQNFETIIIDDASTDGTFNYLKNSNFLPENTFLFRNKTNLGRAGARNKAAKKASGSYLIFFDDDVKLSPDIINTFKELIMNEGFDVMVGKLAPIFDDHLNDFQLYCSYLNDKWSHSHKIERLDKPYITANNFCIRKDLFFSFKGFDERLHDAEDFDLAIRLFEENHSIYSCPSALAYHKIFTSFSRYVQRQIEYRKALNKLNELNHNSLKWRTNIKSKGFKKIFISLLSNKQLLSLLDKELLTFLPKKLRFRFYDIAIQAQIEKSI